MKKAVILSLVILLAISTQVEGKRKKPHRHPKPPPEGRHSNSSCFCKELNVHPTPGHHPSGPHGPQGHHPRGPHGPHGPHHNGHRGPHHRGHKHHRGPHNHGPTGKEGWRKCACRKPDQFKVKFRMIQQWLQDLANSKSEAFRRLAYKITKMLAKVLNTGEESINDMRFTTEGSIVVEFEVKNSEGMKDPGNALKEAIHNGPLSDLQIQPESLTVKQSYSGVKLSEWKLTDEAGCDRCGSVTQTRECTEVTASCDGIPLTRSASCYEACPASRIPTCRGFGKHHRMTKVLIIACCVFVGIIIIAVLVIAKVKRARRKNLKTSPSTSSIKKLADDDKLDKAQSKC